MSRTLSRRLSCRGGCRDEIPSSECRAALREGRDAEGRYEGKCEMTFRRCGGGEVKNKMNLYKWEKIKKTTSFNLACPVPTTEHGPPFQHPPGIKFSFKILAISETLKN